MSHRNQNCSQGRLSQSGWQTGTFTTWTWLKNILQVIFLCVCSGSHVDGLFCRSWSQVVCFELLFWNPCSGGGVFFGGVSSVCLPLIGWLIKRQPSCSLHKEVASTCSVSTLQLFNWNELNKMLTPPTPLFTLPSSTKYQILVVWWINDGLMRTSSWCPPAVTNTSQR